MMEKGQKEKSVDIRPITFHNDIPINDQRENKGKMLRELKPDYPLNYVVYPVQKEN